MLSPFRPVHHAIREHVGNRSATGGRIDCLRLDLARTRRAQGSQTGCNCLEFGACTAPANRLVEQLAKIDPQPCRPDTGGPSSCCAPTRGSRCWARVPRPWPSLVANGLGRARGSGFHVLCHSCVGRILFAWQHRSPSGLVVLHLELELKRPFLQPTQPHSCLFHLILAQSEL